jgi:hypothetical protein
MPPLTRKDNSARLPRIFGLALGLFAFAAAHGAEAASAYFAPTSSVREVGTTFTVSINASSPDQAINGAEITVGFPADRLQVVSLSKSSSIISFWVEEPSFSNADGTIRLQGVIPNPGWKGAAGRLLSVTFRATGEGTAPLRFISGSLLANDGLGTNVLTAFGSASFSVVAAGQAPSVEGAQPPAAATIVSTGFPDQDAWYRPGDLGFAWKRSQGVTGASYLLDASPASVPDAVSEGNVGTAAIKDPGDGVWYFHLRVRNALGWSGATHYRVQLDGTPPAAITMEEVVDADDGITRYRIAAADAGSGIALFRIGIDGGQSLDWQPTEDNLYEPPQLLPGKHVVRIEAVDRAGNSSVMDFPIEQVSIRPPSGVSYTKRLIEGAAFDISGLWAAGLRVALRLQAKDGTATVFTETADGDGRFSFAFPEGLAAGTYTFTLWASDSEGRTSAETPARELLIVPKEAGGMDGSGKGFYAGLMEKAGSPVVVALAFAAIVLMAAFLATLRARRAFRRGLIRYKVAIRRAFAEAERESAGHEHPGLHQAEKLVQQAIRELEKLLK